MVIAFGEVLWDILPSGKKLGGAVANCAYRLHQLGTPVSFVSRIGDDELGKEALDILKEKGLPCPMLQMDSHKPTGTVDVSVSPEGDADYVINKDVAYDYIESNEALLKAASTAKALVFGNLIQRELTSRNTLYELLDAAPQALKIVDINLRKDCYSEETVRQSLARTDIVKLNDKEVQVVSSLIGLKAADKESFCSEVLETFDVSTVLVSLGAQGVYAHDKKEGPIKIQGYPAKVADTVGAGDNFTAGFVHKRLIGADLQQSCEFGNLIGAIVATKTGGMPSLSMDEIQEYKSSHEKLRASA